MIRVSMITPWEQTCGIADYAHTLAEPLRELVDLQVVALPDLPRRAGFELMRHWRDDVSRMHRIARQVEGALCHIQHQYPFFGGMAPGRNKLPVLLNALRLPITLTVHEIEAGGGALRGVVARRINRWLFDRPCIRGFIVHSRHYRDLMTRLGVQAPVEVIPIPAPVRQPSALSREQAKARLGLSGKRVLAMFGFVVRRKGHARALEILSRLPDDYHLLIAGGKHPLDASGYCRELTAEIDARGLDGRVTITGVLPADEIADTLQAVDAALAPFDEASSSASLNDLLAHRIPVIAADLPTLREMTDDSQCLLLAPPNDIDKWLNHVRDCVEGDAAEALAEGIEAYLQARQPRRIAVRTVQWWESLRLV